MATSEILLLDCGSGGRASQRLVSGLFLRHFSNPALNSLDDAALLEISGPVSMSTDSYTVDPIEFPGGNIGSLAVHGTVNDVSMLGARPLYLSCGFILEEGLPMDVLERVVAAMAEAAAKAGVSIVTGDTKVVPRGAADKIFINTTGLGQIITPEPPSGRKAAPGDAVLISGSLGDHGLTILSQRAGLSVSPDIKSDSAALNHMANALVRDLPVHVLRDPTRGGLATTLNEITEQSGVICRIFESALPVKKEVGAGCSLLGLDPLYLANEGKLICILPRERAEEALRIMRSFPEGREAVQIGEILEPGQAGKARSGQVVLQTALGGSRLLGMLEGEQLPRIC